MKPPSKLYKYCSINTNSLRSILRARLYYAPPVQFNDPLDCNPSLELDLNVGRLEALVRKMHAERGVEGEQVERELHALAYFASGPDDPNDSPEYWASYSFQLGEEIKRLLRKDLGFQGVLALSERWNEPLMWSHYAAQHQGICIEFETTGYELKRLKPIDYNAPRSIRAHDLYRWKCDGDARAEQRVFDTYFYAKAPQWSYEKEWRDVSDKAGNNPSHFELTAIHLGMRTDFVWKWMLIKTLHLDQQVALYDVKADEKSFRLHRSETDRDQIERRAIEQPLYKMFGRFGLSDEIVKALYHDDEPRPLF